MPEMISKEHGISKQAARIKINENKVKKNLIKIIKQIKVKKKISKPNGYKALTKC